MTRLSAVAALSGIALSLFARPGHAHHDEPRRHVLDIAGAYLGEVMRPSRADASAAHRGLLEVQANLDLEELGLLPGALHVRAQGAYGAETTRKLNALQRVSGIEAAPFLGVAAAWYQYGRAHEGLRVRFGLQDANVEYASSDHAAAFVHSSFGLPPTIGLPSYPEPALAASVGYRISRQLDIAAGIFEGSNGAGRATVAQVRLRNASAAAAFSVGGWNRDRTGGFFAVVDASIRVRDMGAADLPHGFLQVAWAAAPAENEPPFYLGGGLIGAAPFGLGIDDELGFAVAHVRAAEADLANIRAVPVGETAAELFYCVRPDERIVAQVFLMPIVAHGAGGHDIVFGLRTSFTF